MGGVRTAGDLVARMQLNRGMRIDAAKKYVAESLGVAVSDLNDPIVMGEVRDDKNIFWISEGQTTVDGIAAKYNISKLLDLDINCVNRFLKNTGLG
ncbi:dimethylamine:corrinoid methyltransferase [Desulforhopalus singaporensis]|uniref:Dimethylamine:corrinoid methyltransferase n=1 Tax=Desulforhopalus singaporensis TaxID=91360 RepID=A0A1H0IYT7_9BACT|nr:dimethylamine:corrinoid methyltransferase [Desulforhopalus singaporensis]